jgi:hypothetical protein
VAPDPGRLSAADRARLRRARKRAGLVRGENAAQKAGREEDGSYSRPGNTVRDAETGKVRRDYLHPKRPASPASKRISQKYQSAWEAPVRGESAKEKARVGVQGRVRDDFERLQYGKMGPTEFARSVRKSLSPSETRDFERYAAVRSDQVQDQINPWRKTDEMIGMVTGVKPSDAFWSVTHPVDRVTGRTRRGMKRSETFEGGWEPKDGGGAGFGGFGLGRLGGKAVSKAVEPAAKSPEAQRVMDALPGAKKARKAQEAGYHEARVKGAAAIQEAMKKGGLEGHEAAKAALRGELPKLKYGALEELDQTAAERLFKDIQNHPDLKPYDKVHTVEALRRMIGEGRVPTAGEMKQFERVFGPDVAGQIKDSAGFWRKAKEAGVEILNVPRALKATLDLSAPFRQGLVLGARHPVMFAKNLKPMVQAWKSESVYDDVMAEIADRPSFDMMRQSGVHFTDLGHVDTREEAFMSNLAEKIPVLGPQGVRRSSRAYTAFLNKFRADAFDNYIRVAEQDGRQLAAHERRDIANWVNTATGRGQWKAVEGAMVPATMVLFSPRLLLSRLQLLNPVYYAQLSPVARKEAVRGMTQLAGAVTLTLSMAKMAGAEVNMDPRNTDFGKIKFGDTRVDILGGLQQPFVAAYRIAKGESVSSTTGVEQEADRGLIARNFIGNKLAPVPGYGRMWLNDENFAGDEFNPYKEAARLHIPIGVENTYEGFKDSPEAGIASATLGSIGFGVSTYDGDPAKTAEAKRKAALAKRGPAHVRRHEDDMAKLKAEAKRRGVDVPQEAVKASRRIRDLDMQLRRAEKKGPVTYKQRAELTKAVFLKVFPHRRSVVEQRFGETGGDMARWEKLYRLMRSDLRAPYSDLLNSIPD